MNPQFFVQIPRTASAKCHVVVSVTQHYETRDDQPKKKKTMHAIGFAVYEVPTTFTRLTSHFVTEHVISTIILSSYAIQVSFHSTHSSCNQMWSSI